MLTYRNISLNPHNYPLYTLHNIHIRNHNLEDAEKALHRRPAPVRWIPLQLSRQGQFSIEGHLLQGPSPTSHNHVPRPTLDNQTNRVADGCAPNLVYLYGVVV